MLFGFYIFVPEPNEDGRQNLPIEKHYQNGTKICKEYIKKEDFDFFDMENIAKYFYQMKERGFPEKDAFTGHPSQYSRSGQRKQSI